MSLTPSKTTHIANPLRLRIPCSTTQKWYFIHPGRAAEYKDSQHGKVVIMATIPLSNVNSGGDTSVIIRCRWKYEFRYPDLPESSGPEPEHIFSDSDAGLFTTSDSTWKAGKYLTFKHKSGGSMAGFPGGQPWAIYKLDEHATVKFIKTGGTEEKVKYGVIHGVDTTEYGLPLLVPFADLTQAKKFASSKADVDMPAYVAAGPWASPNNPAWFRVADSELEEVRVTCQAHCRNLEGPGPSVARALVQNPSVDRTLKEAQKQFQNLLNFRTTPTNPLQGLLFSALHKLTRLNIVDYGTGLDIISGVAVVPADLIQRIREVAKEVIPVINDDIDHLPLPSDPRFPTTCMNVAKLDAKLDQLIAEVAQLEPPKNPPVPSTSSSYSNLSEVEVERQVDSLRKLSI